MTTYAVGRLERNPSFPSTPVFLSLWVPAGFVLGTLALLGPVRWWANLCRHFEIAQRIENGGVFVIIGMLFMTSGYTARIITNILESSHRAVQVLTLGIVMAMTGSAVAAWMHPALMSASMAGEQGSARFTFGPYPDEARMERLKRDGYTIVSLLHPAVVPFEPKLLSDEKALAQQIGVRLIHVPMLPWVSGNADALATIKQLANDPARRFYFHCYLGQDRVRIVRHALEQAGFDLASDNKSRRSIRNVDRLERGRVYRLGSGVYVTGYPTDDEFVRYVVSGEIRQVVAFLDANDAKERALIDRERLLLDQHQVPFTLVQSDSDRFDPDRVSQAVRYIADSPKPVLVHAFLSPSTSRAPWTEAFMQTFFSRRPSLPASLFIEPLKNGRVTVVATHVAMGPRPTRSDFRELERRGVAECIHVGKERVSVDAKYAAKAGLRWTKSTGVRVVAAVRTGGPYYVYGSGAAAARAALERAYGRPVPLTTR